MYMYAIYMYVQNTFTVQKGHSKCTIPQKEAFWPPHLVMIFYHAICIDIENVFDKKV